MSRDNADGASKRECSTTIALKLAAAARTIAFVD
jgi:hypothetical protein